MQMIANEEAGRVPEYQIKTSMRIQYIYQEEFERLRDFTGNDANSHFPRPAGPHFPASQGHIKRSALEIGRARGAPPC